MKEWKAALGRRCTGLGPLLERFGYKGSEAEIALEKCKCPPIPSEEKNTRRYSVHRRQATE